MIRIGITGANGFIGTALIKFLMKDSNVYQIKTFTRSYNPYGSSSVQSFYGEIMDDVEIFSRFLDSIDVLVYLSEPFTEDIEYLFSTQLRTTYLTCEAIKKSYIKKIIYLSSIAVYGEGYSKRESDQLNPTTNYGLFKMLSENIFRLLQNFGKKVIILRPTNIYGEMSHKGALYHFINNIKNQKNIKIYGDGTQKREFLYIEDCVDAIEKSIDFEGSDTFNISGKELVSLNDLIGVLKKIYNKDIRVEYLPADESNPLQVLSENIEHAKKSLNWEPRTSLLNGLRKTIGKQSI